MGSGAAPQRGRESRPSVKRTPSAIAALFMRGISIFGISLRLNMSIEAVVAALRRYIERKAKEGGA